MPETDPLSQVYTSLADLARASVPLQSMVKVGNLLRFDSPTNRDPKKEILADADLPELVLLPDTGAFGLHATSSSSKATRQYTWKINTGDFRLAYRLNPIEWMLACAMAGWKSALGPLTWRGEHFVKRLDAISVSSGMSDPLRNDGIQGWSSVWQCEVEMHFRTSDLIQYHATGE